MARRITRSKGIYSKRARERLRIIRRFLHIRQVDVDIVLKLGKSYYQKIELGEKRFQLNDFVDVLAFFNARLEEQGYKTYTVSDILLKEKFIVGDTVYARTDSEDVGGSEEKDSPVRGYGDGATLD